MPPTAQPRKKELWFPCGGYFLRTIKREDASERWAGWLSDPHIVHVLNTAPKTLGKSDIADYIRQFDQRSQLLLGIFQKRTRLHVGFVRVDIDYQHNDALVNAVIGEAAHRNAGATTVVFVPLLDYLFDTVGLDKVKASVLRRNQATRDYLARLGWQTEPTQQPPVRSHADGSLLEMDLVSYTKVAYREFRQTGLGRRILRRLAAAKGQVQ
jgi:RimJ/RimL family protein N-acetyltransferase